MLCHEEEDVVIVVVMVIVYMILLVLLAVGKTIHHFVHLAARHFSLGENPHSFSGNRHFSSVSLRSAEDFVNEH